MRNPLPLSTEADYSTRQVICADLLFLCWHENNECLGCAAGNLDQFSGSSVLSAMQCVCMHTYIIMNTYFAVYFV